MSLLDKLFILSLININLCLSDNISSYQKCCNANEHLIKQSDNLYNCTLNNYRLTNFYQENESVKNRTYCVDLTLNHTSSKLLLINNNELVKELDFKSTFTKCCPLGYVYGKNERNCIETNNTHENLIKSKSAVVTIGFRYCNDSVIYDVFYEEYDSLLSDASKLDSKQYCLDETKDSLYVLRKCYSQNFCDQDGITCVRKCCPVGHHYEKGQTRCSKYPAFRRGFNYKHLYMFDKLKGN